MTNIKSFSLLACLVLCVLMAQTLQAQTSVFIYAEDGSGWRDSVKIGINPTGTYGLDAALSESELPPLPPTGVPDFRSVDLPGYATATPGGHGQGFSLDLRHQTLVTQKDTFKLCFKGSTEATGPVTLSWQAGLSAVGGGGWILGDIFGGLVFATIDMTTQTSFQFTFPGSPSDVNYVYIYKGDGQQHTTFTYNQIADALNSKGKQKAEKRAKPGKPVFPPNVNNVGDEVYLQAGSTALSKSGNPKSILHAKWKDAAATANSKGSKHTGPAKCLDKFESGKDILKAQKKLPATKHNNKLVGCALALKLAIGASDKGKTPSTGFGNLVYNNPSSPYNGQTVNQIMTDIDNYLSCDLTGLKGGATAEDLYNVAAAITSAFALASTQPLVDTVTWLTGTKLKVKGGKRIMEQNTLYRASIGSPGSVPDFPVAESAPERFELRQNYPNPFNPSTIIEFNLPDDAFVTIKVYNMLGQEVATLANHEEFLEGGDDVEFDASRL